MIGVAPLYIALLICGGCLGMYVYLSWHFDHWRKRCVPGPSPKLLHGTFPGTVNGKRNIIYDLDEIYRQYKKTCRFVGVFMTRNPQLMLLDKELCKDVLIRNFKSFQDNESSKWMDRSREPISGSNPFVLPFSEWKAKRAEIVAGITLLKVKGMFPIISAISRKLILHLKEKFRSGSFTIDAKELALRYTGEVVADVVWCINAKNFELSATDSWAKESLFLRMSKRMIAQTFQAFRYYFIVGIIPTIRHIIYVRFHPEETDNFFLKLAQSAIQARQSMASGTRSDFLQHLLELRQKKGLSDTEIVAHMLTFLFDGFETSATVISHCLLLLARYPETQEKLRQEIYEELDSHHNILELDQIMKLPYLDQCVAETLRIFTPLPFMAKMCTQACQLVNSDGVTLAVQPGDVCLISLHSMHHDEEYFPQPEEFMPDMLTFLFDGFETSATVISHCLLLLARYPETQEKLRQEIYEELDSHHNILELDQIMKLPYLDQCVAETLRIFTPLPFMAKMCTQACQLVNSDGVTLAVQPGDVCLISLHSMHHDEEYFPQPEEFMPDRFAEENGGTKKYRDLGVYLPFGDGPRICLGMTFGLAQTKTAIVEVIRHFKLNVNQRTRSDNYQGVGGFITGLDGGIFLDIKEL